MRFGTTAATSEYIQSLTGESSNGYADAKLEVGVGIKPISRVDTQRLVSGQPSSTPSTQKRKSVTFVHKGNIMKYTDGRVPRLGL